MSTRRAWIVHAVLYLALFGGLTFGLVRVFDESAERKDQNCKIFERSQERDIKRLANTYAYLERLSPDERAETINRAVFADLTNLEAEARQDDAPVYCDEKGVGLAEPDLPIPERPKALK